MGLERTQEFARVQRQVLIESRHRSIQGDDCQQLGWNNLGSKIEVCLYSIFHRMPACSSDQSILQVRLRECACLASCECQGKRGFDPPFAPSKTIKLPPSILTRSTVERFVLPGSAKRSKTGSTMRKLPLVWNAPLR